MFGKYQRSLKTSVVGYTEHVMPDPFVVNSLTWFILGIGALSL